MGNTLIRIWIHAWFSTKDIMPLIKDNFESKIHEKIRKKIESEYKSFVKNINGTENHIHILFMLNPIYNISDILKNVKGESSHWVNQNRFIEAKFSWQRSYDAVSVSESMVESVDAFISNQKSYHKKFTYQEEREIILKKFANTADKTV